MPEEPSHPFRAGTDVVVVNNNEPPEQHRVFYDASTRYAGRARFLTKAAIDPPLECPSRRRSKVKPAVQKQSCDLVSAFRALLGVTPRARHVMLLEDDWLLCPHGLSAALYAVDKAYAYDPRWIALRVSYGFNGVVVKQGDLDSLAHHLATHYSRRPPDHLLFEWFSGERPDTRENAAGRSYRIFRYNVFHHIGHISTLAQPTNRYNPGCYALLYDWLLPAEVFNEKECPDDDLWPCKEARGRAGHTAFFGAARLLWSAPARKAVDLAPDKNAVVSPFDALPTLHAHRTGADAEPQPQLPSPEQQPQEQSAQMDAARASTSTPTPFVAQRGESCRHACHRSAMPGSHCSRDGLRALNTCAALRQHMPGGCAAGCEHSTGADQPALVAEDAPVESMPGVCLVNDLDPECEGKHRLTTRLCACV